MIQGVGKGWVRNICGVFHAIFIVIVIVSLVVGDGVYNLLVWSNGHRWRRLRDSAGVQLYAYICIYILSCQKEKN